MLDGFCKVSAPRLRRLFAVAISRYAFHHFAERRYHSRLEACLDTVERYADGLTPRDEVTAAAKRLRKLPGEGSGSFQGFLRAAAEYCCHSDNWQCIAWVQGKFPVEFALDAGCLGLLEQALDHFGDPELRGTMRKVFRGFVRDIFGSPFQRVSFDAASSTETSRGLAKSIYESRNFDALPILADALEEAGCIDPHILMHCRRPGVHARGCWVLDLLLGFRKPIMEM
jgi:hypothetical protein